MIRVFAWTSLLIALSTVSARAQITSSPVVTSWPSETRIMYSAPPAAPPVSMSVCTPPVVTYCNPCMAGSVASMPPAAAVPVTANYVPTIAYAVPTATFAVPTTTRRWPLTLPQYRPTVTYVVPPPTYFNPITTYRMPTPPQINVATIPYSAAPITTYYAPTVSSPMMAGRPTMMSAPVVTRRGCGCSGRLRSRQELAERAAAAADGL